MKRLPILKVLIGSALAVLQATGFAASDSPQPSADSPYVVLEQDTSLRALLSRWATIEGKELVWHSVNDAVIYDPDILNTLGRFSRAKNLDSALGGLNRAISKAPNQAWDVPLSLAACVFDKHVVVYALPENSEAYSHCS